MTATEPRRASTGQELRYWRAVGGLPADRRDSFQALEACFRDGGAVGRLDGPQAGRLVATTVGYGLDLPFETMARLWMPWRGKILDASAAEGRNLFESGFRPMMRLLWPRYRDDAEAGPGRITAFRFTTREGPSVLFPEVDVLRIDYDLPESPSFLIRSVLDEVVRIDDGLYLGQALLKVKGEHRRAAWFQLRTPD